MASGVLIFNPGAGSSAGVRAEDLVGRLSRTGDRVTTRVIGEGENPHDVARECLGVGYDWIAAAGGDGTVEAVGKALLGSETPLGVIACGTYNNFALSLGLPSDPLEACDVITAGQTRRIDVGLANGEPFFECAGVGLDAAVFPLGEAIKSGGFSKWLEFFHRAYHYPKQRLTFTLDRPIREALSRPTGRRWRSRRHRFSTKALLTTVSNGPYYGMNFTVAPHARLDDGLFTVSIFRRFNKLDLWWHFFSISAGRRTYAPQLTTLRVPRLEISGPRKVSVHLDGSPFDAWPLKIEIRCQCLRIFFAPPTSELPTISATSG